VLALAFICELAELPFCSHKRYQVETRASLLLRGFFHSNLQVLSRGESEVT
jgi:hypothetical protein